MKIKEILIVMGSKSDLPLFDDAMELLKKFKIPNQIRILSAHRSPKLLIQQIEHLSKSVHVIVAAAGGAAHLAGVVAAHTLKPVIGVPALSALKGVDSFVSTSQMPAGIPVATMSIGKAGATNAILLATEILALHDQILEKKLISYRKAQVKKIRGTNREFLRKRR